MKIQFILATILLLGLLACSKAPSPTAVQTETIQAKEGGGGDTISQEFSAAVQRLPETLKSYGWDLFPEINPAELQALVRDPQLHIELASEAIFINKVKKHARNFPEKKLIQLDGAEIAELLSGSNAEERLNALALHEILGLLKIEGTNDYHVSNRLLSGSKMAIECKEEASAAEAFVRVSFDYVAVQYACLIPAKGGARTCQYTSSLIWMKIADGDVVETTGTRMFELVGVRASIRLGTERFQRFLRDEKGGGRQTFTMTDGSLAIDWKVGPSGANGILQINGQSHRVRCQKLND